MIKKIFFTSLAFIINLASFAQVIPLNDNVFTNSRNYNLVKTKVYDNSGGVISGYLYYATDSTLIISNLPKDSVYFYKAEDIYRLSFKYRYNFYGVAGSTFTAMQVLNLWVGKTATKDHFPSNLVIGTVAIVTPVTIISAAVAPLLKFNYDYITDYEKNNYNIVSPVLQKKSLSPVSEIQNISPERKIRREIKTSKTPLKFRHPLHVSLFHFIVGYNISSNLIPNQIRDWALKTDIGLIYYDVFAVQHFSYNFGIRVLKNFRLNLGYLNDYDFSFYGEKHYENSDHHFGQFVIESKLKIRSITAQYVINPVNRILQNKNEFSVMLSYLNADFNISRKITYYDYDLNLISELFDGDDFNLNGLALSSEYNYYLTNSISINTGISYNYLPKQTFAKIGYTFNGADNFTFDENTLKFGSMRFFAGLGLHLF